MQIITALYHNYPSQRILLVTHSNAALNDLFAKIEEVMHIYDEILLFVGY